MKKLSLLPIVICALAMVCSSITIISPNTAEADPNKPNWFSGEPIYQEGRPDTERKSCVMEERPIRALPGHIYDNDNPNTTRQVCVYKAEGYEYAYYVRFFYIDPTMMGMGTTGEGGIAIALNGSQEMVPSKGINNNDIDTFLYTGSSSRMLINRSRTCPTDCFYGVSIYRDASKHLSVNADGYMVLDYHPDFEYQSSEGVPVRTIGVGLSNNTRWLALFIPSMGLVRLDLDTFQVLQVSDRFDYESWTYPRPVPSISISDDGSYIVSGGANMATQVIVVNVGCGIDGHDLTYHYTKQSIGSKNCSFIDLTSMTNSHSRTPYSSYVSFKDVRMSASGSMFTYWDDYKWSTIYAPNYLMPGQLYYLALGDSYASGEGDITSDGVNHYFSGTDVYGNYNQGIPRETCHLSTRSYSMRISSAMQLMKGTDMQSVACSGAVMSDILSLDRANDGYINSNYLGQSTQLISTVGARLTGVANATGLQTEARQDYTPGRIQQIELVKKAQPHYLTVMVGGNDLDFGGVLTACAENALPSTDETCDYATGSGFAGEIKKIHDLYPKLVEFYKALHEVSPKTIIYVIGYPQFMDENSDSCKQMLDLYSKPERKAIHQMIAYTNAVIKNAALDAGVKYIDISDALTGGQLCDTSTDMTGITDIFAVSVYTEYMKSLTMSDSKIAAYLNAAPSGLLRDIALQLYITERAAEVANKIAYSPATALADVMQELSHPNALGHEAIYKAIHDALGDDLLESTACNQRVACSDGTIHGQPDVNAYVTDFALDASNDTVYVGVDGKVRVGHKETSDSMMLGALVKRASDQFVRISAEDLPSTIDSTQPVTVEVHSQPIVLGNMDMVGGVYELQTSLDQNGIRAGMHVLHIKGRLTDGRAFDADASIFVEGPSGDIDDDGIADNIDTCAFGDTAGSDIDKDGVDDACDFDVSQQLSVHSHANTPSIDNNNLNRVTGVSTSGTDDATYNSEASLFMSHKKSIGDLAKRYVSTSVRAPISSMFIIVMTTVGLLLVLTGCYIVTARRRG